MEKQIPEEPRKLEAQPKTPLMLLTAEEIAEITAYNGFPVRYPHWKWGNEYEILHRK